mmetsp:Transcript_12941/g.11465  ORF Transcript_12941/g.11465 Transcript_12941/m.11465 type:complete len:90 (-) Transcript_12941:79-348(-)
MFSGYIFKLREASVYFAWLQYLSPLRYGMEILMRSEIEGNPKYLFGEKIIEDHGYTLGMVPCVIILILFAIVLRVLSLFALKLTIKKAQ